MGTFAGLDEGDPNDLFEKEESLGEGSYGEVFKASYKDASKKGKVAIKIIPVDDDMEELEKEVAILKRAKDDFVVDYVGAYMENEPHRIWIAMELCEAGSVNDLIHICQTNLDEEQIVDVVASALLGLQFLHGKKMIHRDIKAGNILLTEDGQAKLADFGVSAQLGPDQDKRKTVIGTPFWMAPEVISETSYDGRADVWSLGITIIEMAQMEPPYSNIHPMRAIFMIPSRPSPKLDRPEDWSKRMNEFLAKCLQKKPEKRPTSEELMDDPWVAEAVARLDTATPRGHSQVIEDLVKAKLADIDQARLDEAQGRTSRSSRDSTGSAMQGNTAHYQPAKRSSTRSGTDTMEQLDRVSGTMVHIPKAKDTAIFTPSTNSKTSEAPFMRYFNSKKKTAKARASRTLVDKDDDWIIPQQSEEMILLTQRLQSLDVQFSKDVNDLRRAYERRRAALVNAAQD